MARELVWVRTRVKGIAPVATSRTTARSSYLYWSDDLPPDHGKRRATPEPFDQEQEQQHTDGDL